MTDPMGETHDYGGAPDDRMIVQVPTEAPTHDEIRTFYEVPDELAMRLWGDRRTTFCEALVDLLSEATDARPEGPPDA